MRRSFCLAEWRVCVHGRKATADSLLWHPSSLMKKDRVFVWFLCHWWVFLFSSSMKLYVITQISSQVISLSLCRSYKHCQLMTRSWYKEGRRFHLPPVCWKERAQRIALSAQAASSLDSFVGFHSHRWQLSWAIPYSSSRLSNASPLTMLSPLTYVPSTWLLLDRRDSLSTALPIVPRLSLRP